MPQSASSGDRNRSALRALDRRAEVILRSRPGYREMVEFYLPIFRRQIEWRDRLVVVPEEVPAAQVLECLRGGVPLLERFDPGLDADSLAGFWAEMKKVVREGNDTLRQAVDKIDQAEEAGSFAPASWLLERRPDDLDSIADAAGRIDVAVPVLATLGRIVTFPHWELVSESWLPQGRPDGWKRFRCPTCGGLPGLAEIRAEQNGTENIKPASRRWMHCPFCGSRWGVPPLECPACGSRKSGDAKYLFTADEPELRIDFCNSCQHYVKVIDGGKISGRVHVGLELLAAAHLDVLAGEKKLSPLEVPT